MIGMKKPAKAKNIMVKLAEATRAVRIVYSAHANQRLKEREIIKPEVEFVLANGHHEARKDQFNEVFQAWDYSIRGKTVDGRELRVVVGFIEPQVLIVTVIDLDKKD